MAIINLRKHYYPLYTTDTFVEVPDEVAAVMEECRLYENRQEGRKSYYHVYSMDCSPGIENQKAMLLQYAMEQGWEVYNLYSDDDYTGSDRRRPEFNRLLEDAKGGRFRSDAEHSGRSTGRMQQSVTAGSLLKKSTALCRSWHRAVFARCVLLGLPDPVPSHQAFSIKFFSICAAWARVAVPPGTSWPLP